MNPETFESVWDALADSEQEAASLKARSQVLFEIRKAVKGWRLSRQEAAARLGLSEPRLDALLRGRLTEFSLDALVALSASAKLDVEITVKGAA